MTTYLLITSGKPTELTAFVGPKDPLKGKPTPGYKKWARISDDHFEKMETAKASRLPVVNVSIRDSVHGLNECKILFGLDGPIEIKLDTPVELEGWELEKVYQESYGKGTSKERWEETSEEYYEKYSIEAPEFNRQAYRLIRSEPVKPNNSPFDLLDLSPIEEKTQEWDWSKKSPELKALCWVLDRIWAKVSPAGEATTSWGRQESGKAIEAYMNSILAPESHKTQEIQDWDVVIEKFNVDVADKSMYVTATDLFKWLSKRFILINPP